MEKRLETKLYTAHYDVFPGIQLFYSDIHTKEASLKISHSGCSNFFEIIHCREGRMEFNVGDHYYYVAAGDLLITQKPLLTDTLYFPLEHYHGIAIHIDINKAPKCLSCFLKDVSVEPLSIKQKFSSFDPCFIARSNVSFEHIFSELYTVPNSIKAAYFKIKILELMLFLSAFPMENNEIIRHEVSPYHVKLAKEVCKYLTLHIDERIPLNRISEQLGISSSKIKIAFKQVYGISFYSFLKAHKMESAAYMLEHTDRSILEIANKHGYENSSKFASAFKSAKGISPREYRSTHRKENDWI